MTATLTQTQFEIQVSKSACVTGLSQAIKAIAKNSTLPILSCVLIERVEGGMTFTCYNTKVGIRTFVPIEAMELDAVETVKIAVEAKRLLDIVKSSKGKEISLKQEGNVFRVLSETSQFDLLTADPSEFPNLPSGESESIVITGQVLNTLIYKTQPACSTEEIRPVLTGVKWTIENQSVTCVATDSHRLHKAIRSVNGPEINDSFIIAAESLIALQNIFADDSEVSIGVANGHFFAKSDRITYVSRLLDGNFPDTNRVIPTAFNVTLVVNRQDLLSALERASIMAKDDNHVCRVTLEQGNLIVSSQSEGTGKMKESVALSEQSANEFEIAFNTKFMVTSLKLMNSEMVTVKMINPMSPIVLEGVGVENEMFLLLPVRTY